MSASFADRLYPRLPVPLQNLACSYYGFRESRVRFGRAFDARLQELLVSDRWSAGQISAYQDEQLRSLVRHAYTHVPYYRERMREANLVPSDIRGRADLHKLPILTKEDVRRHGRGLLAETARRSELVARHTSGTTGKSLDFYSTVASMSFQWAVWWRHRMRFGMRPGDWHANFTGKLVVPLEQVRPPFHRINMPWHQVLVNMQHIEPPKLAAIVEGLSQRNLVYWSGYPSIIHQFARLALERGVVLPSKPRFVVTGAERMHEFQRRDIAAVTGALLTDQYGLSEGAGNASPCERGTYHEDFEFGILECLDPKPVEGGTEGQILMTGFACPEFPFIRYAVGDVGVWKGPSDSCGCGRSSSALSRVEGRVEDYVVTPEGRRIMRFDYCFKGSANVEEAQVVQRRLGAVTLRIVRRPSFSSSDEEMIAAEIARWISPRLQVEFEYVKAIEREPGGKFRAVKSALPPSPAAVMTGVAPRT